MSLFGLIFNVFTQNSECLHFNLIVQFIKMPIDIHKENK